MVQQVQHSILPLASISQDVLPLWSSQLYSFWVPDIVIPMSKPILMGSLTPAPGSRKASSSSPSNCLLLFQYSALCLLCRHEVFEPSGLILSDIRWVSPWPFSFKDHVFWCFLLLAPNLAFRPHNWALSLPSAHSNPSNQRKASTLVD